MSSFAASFGSSSSALMSLERACSFGVDIRCAVRALCGSIASKSGCCVALRCNRFFGANHWANE